MHYLSILEIITSTSYKLTESTRQLTLNQPIRQEQQANSFDKRQWITDNFFCPVCRVDASLTSDNACSSCKSIFSQDSRALNFISPEMRTQFTIVPTANVSAHRYDPICMEMINSGGMVLDCGSGKKDIEFENLIQMEIVDYDNVDVLAVNQLLPFKDASFDAVMSLAVLEHVDQPFDCAAEILRVLKPGGRLYVGVPFLQREHGYPHHYFGMTRMGLRRLFGDNINIEKHYVPMSGHPVWALWMSLQTYRDGLPAAEKSKFESLTVADILEKSPVDHLGTDWVSALNEEARWKIATTTALIANKK